MIEKNNNEPNNPHIQQSIGDGLNIKHGKIKKQLPAKVMKREFNHKMFTVRRDKEGL